MGKIRQLPVEIAAKIAAGEVIERPASVVKELVENAIDAGATRIDVELRDAGKALIRVADNGEGMDADDLRLALVEHATSKLARVDDLFYIDTMGFRGEALSSIASISHVHILSRPANTDAAHEIIADGEHAGELRPCAGAPGTVITVEHLFYNTPVRRRFLRQNPTEVSHVIDVLERMALAFPRIAFSLSNDQARIFDLPPTNDIRERMVAFGDVKDPADLLAIQDDDDYCSIRGYVGGINLHRPNSKGMRLFVNGRFIRDRSLLQALNLAYREYIPPGRYPVAYIFITLDPSEVDVNVHPTKIEVRFAQANRIFGRLKGACQSAVLRSGQLPRINLKDRRLSETLHPGGSSQSRIHAAMHEYLDRHTPGQLPHGTQPFAAPPQAQARPGDQHEPELELATPGYDVPEHAPHGSFATPGPAPEPAGQEALATQTMAFNHTELQRARSIIEKGRIDPQPAKTPALPAAQTSANTGLLTNARGLFQVGDTYIVVETDDGMVLIDQHAYHERVLYWRLEERMGRERPEVQRLLTPEPLELSAGASKLMAEYRDFFAQAGFEIDRFGPESWACYAVPRYVKLGRATEYILECLEELAQSGRGRDPASLRKSMIETMACHAAVKAGDRLSTQEIQALLAEGAKVPHTFACPHGRPTTFKLSYSDLEKIFHRR